jgi:hypothetical protein
MRGEHEVSAALRPHEPLSSPRIRRQVEVIECLESQIVGLKLVLKY